MLNNKIFSFLFVFFFSFANVLAQNQQNSPYSRFGIGDLQMNVLPEHASMGGCAIASFDPNVINPYNPASYTAFKTNSFLFSTGGKHQTTSMQTASLEQITNNSTFSHLILGFPISKQIGASVGILPYSNIGYNIEDVQTHLDLGRINYSYIGEGGLNILYLGSAYQLNEHLSFGANANYLFGGIHRNKKAFFTDEQTFNTRKTSTVSAKGFFYQLGIIYNKKFSEEIDFRLGVSANNNAQISAKRTLLTETFELQSGFLEVVKDTVENTSTGFVNNMVLPKNIGIGIAVDIQKRLLFMTDFSIQDWSNYRLFGETDSLINSMRITTGIQYTPDNNAINKYWKLIKFRCGARYEQTYLQLHNTQLNDKSISFGLGLPLLKTRSEINLSLELGERGTIANNLIKEKYLRFQIGLSLSDIWFVKRKYD